ncbi:MAG: type II secretion system major pseudopilin GspG [Phycisphaerales bacterium]|nr:type II secretion system major pseudopilin GspG [Phycisphaerales bacterium]
MELKSKYARSAFTLFEVMIVIAIIVAIGGLVGLSVLSRKKDADKDLAKVQIKSIESALEGFHLKYDRWPTDEEGLAVLWSKDTLSPDADAAKWAAELKSPIPTDKWGTPWGYRAVSEHGDETKFDLWSNGPDKQEGTEDDIKNWTDDGEGAPTDSGTPSTTGGSSTTGG